MQYVIPPPIASFDNLPSIVPAAWFFYPSPFRKPFPPSQNTFGPRFLFCAGQAYLGGCTLYLNKSCLAGSDSHKIERSGCCCYNSYCPTWTHAWCKDWRVIIDAVVATKNAKLLWTYQRHDRRDVVCMADRCCLEGEFRIVPMVLFADILGFEAWDSAVWSILDTYLFTKPLRSS